MNLSEEEFWKLNLKKLDALIARKNNADQKLKKEADFRAGVIASVYANVHRDKKKKTAPYKPQDFMPVEKKPEQNWKTQLKIVEMLNVAFGGCDKRGGGK